MKNVAGWFLIVLIAVGWRVQAQEADVEQTAGYDTFKTIYEKNIFSKNRYTPASRQGGGAVRMEKVVLSLYVLRGVAVETQKRLAFVEDEISGQWKRMVVGQELLNGTISEIQSDHVVFVENDQVRSIRIGQEFDRIESEVERPASETDVGEPNAPAAAPIPAKKSEPASSQDQDVILKQMQERRRREMGT